MTKRSVWWRLGPALPLLLLAGLPAAADTPPPLSASIVMSDTGFNPTGVTIQPGGTVTWTNQGHNVHTATSIGGAPFPFNTGGLGPGQSASFSFGIPGNYYYTSATDCQSGNVLTFPCGVSFLITVTSASVEATSAAATAVSGPPTSTPTATPVPANLPPPIVTVNITDTGFDQPSVTVALEGTVQFINLGFNVHSATSASFTGWPGFDSGGLTRGQIFNVGFSQPGTFTYTSAPDCLNGNRNPSFNCAPYSIVVSSIALPIPTTPPTPGPTPIPTLAAPNANPQVILTDGGFQPSLLIIKAGQTVTWIDQATRVHTVTSDATYTPAFDSGGMNPQQTFSVKFHTPGSFGYHSTTDVTYFQDAGCGCTAPNWLLRGTINVTP